MILSIRPAADWSFRRVHRLDIGWLAAQSAVLLCLTTVLLGAPMASGADTVTGTGTNHAFRFVFTASMFPEVNENDTRAALKVWIGQISQELNVAAEPDPQIFRSVRDLATAFRTNRIDGVGLTALEYARLSHSQKFERLGIATSGGRVTESYVLLVRQGGRIEHLSQLKGCSLNLLDSPRASLATIWLDNELMQSSQGRCVTFFKTINTREKAQSVILPVFFGQVDACLTTSNSFQVMTEMNPQIGQQLRVLAASPEVIPSFFAFTAREGTSVQPELIRAMTRMHENVAGKQMLTLVKADRVVEGPLTWLGPSLEMIACHDRLFGEDPQ